MILFIRSSFGSSFIKVLFLFLYVVDLQPIEILSYLPFDSISFEFLEVFFYFLHDVGGDILRLDDAVEAIFALQRGEQYF